VKVVHPFIRDAQGYGLERNILCTLPGLAAQGIDVVSLEIVEGGADVPPGEFVRRLAEANVRTIRINARGRLPFRLARQLGEVFACEQPDVIHSHGYKDDLGVLLAKTGDAVRMTTVHGWCSRDIKERFYEWLGVQAAKRMDAVVVFCEDYRNRLARRGVRGERVHVAPVGMEADDVPREGVDVRAAWSVPTDAVLVVQVGRISIEKGPDVFVSAALELTDRFPDARFALVGDGPMAGELHEQVRAAGRAESILFPGYVSGIGDLHDASDVLAICSRTEAIPRVLFESGLAAVPTVATAVGGIPEVIRDGETGILCPPGNAATMRDGIASLIEDADRRLAMGEAARERAMTEYNHATCAERLIEVYEAAITRRKR
jgi:glycosyltransferase involved in cell wall biosynthesis